MHRSHSTKAPECLEGSASEEISGSHQPQTNDCHLWSKRGGEDGKRHKRPPSGSGESSGRANRIQSDEELYRRAIVLGKNNQNKGEEVSSDPPAHDRDVQLGQEDRFEIRPKTVSLGRPIRDFLKEIGQQKFIVDENSYKAVKRFHIDDPQNYIQTIVSPKNAHLLVFWRDTPVINEEITFSDWLQQCWTKGIATLDHQSEGKLQYVTIFQVASPLTLKQMVMAQMQWYGSGDRGVRTKSWTLRKDSIDFKDDDGLDVWSALCGTLEIATVIRMLYSYPNKVHRMRLSQIHLRFSDSEKPKTIDILLVLDQPPRRTHPEIDPESESEVNWDADQVAEKDAIHIVESRKPPSHHPVLPDISRTTYGYMPDERALGTFTKLYARISSDSTGPGAENIFEIATSFLENHLVFMGFQNGDWGEPQNILLADKVLGEALYSAWTYRVGRGVFIKDLTFATLSPRTAKYIDKHLSMKSLDQVARFSSQHFEFERVQREIFKRREGHIMKFLMRKHAKELGNPEIYSMEFGRYTSGPREGEPFLFVSFTVGNDIGLHRPMSIAGQLVEALFAGAEQVVAVSTSFAVRSMDPFNLAADRVDPHLLIPGYTLETYGDTERNNLYIECPVIDQLEEVNRLCHDKLRKTLPWGQEDVQNSRYYGSLVGPQEAPDESYMFRIATYGPLKHVVLINSPTKRFPGATIPLGDVLIAAWLKSYPHGKYNQGGHKTNAGFGEKGSTLNFRYVSLLDVSTETQRIFNAIFERMQRPLSKPLVLTFPFTHYRGVNAMYHLRTDPVERLNWLLVMGTEEMSAMVNMFVKFRGYFRDGKIDLVVIRWEGEKGKEAAQVFLGNSPGPPTARAIDDAKRDPVLGNAIILGERNSLINDHVVWIKSGYSTPAITQGSFRFKTLRTALSCPKETLRLLNSEFADALSGKVKLRSSSKTYAAYEITSVTDNFRYQIFVSAENRHIDIQQRLPLGSLNSHDQAKRIGQVLFKAWMKYGPSEFATAPSASTTWSTQNQKEQQDSLRIVTFLRLNDETETILAEAWNHYRDDEHQIVDGENQVLRISNTAMYRSNGEQIPRTQVYGLWSIVMSTPEVAGVVYLLAMHPGRMNNRQITKVGIGKLHSGRMQLYLEIGMSLDLEHVT
ncbi:hypothetical protein TWF696_009422 [Orbilia brochopaga]|uniref:Uncharacterized protein n=1 Tax=Orbilia brochopaga TaxID=3140254 RepID=A0AAV9UAN4_9PEZI